MVKAFVSSFATSLLLEEIVGIGLKLANICLVLMCIAQLMLQLLSCHNISLHIIPKTIAYKSKEPINVR